MLFIIPSGVAGILYLIEQFSGVKIAMTTLSILWFTLPTAIIGAILLYITITQGRKPAELFDIEIDSAKLGASGIDEYPKLGSRRILRVGINLNAIPRKRVYAIQLEIAGNLISSDWQPEFIPTQITTSSIYYFNIPDSIKPNKYSSRIVISLENKKVKSNPFEIEMPK